MGVNYNQILYIGIKIDLDSLVYEEVPSEYEFQSRYNTKTGKKTHEEKVLVKEGYKKYKFMDTDVGDDMYILEDAIRQDYGLDALIDEDNNIIIGKEIGKSKDFGRVDLIEDEFSVGELLNMTLEVQQKLPIEYARHIKLYFIARVG